MGHDIRYHFFLPGRSLGPLASLRRHPYLLPRKILSPDPVYIPCDDAPVDTQIPRVGQLDHVPGAMPTAAYISNHDVSRMHVYAALHPSECNGHRYLLAAGRAPPQALADVLRKIRPQWKDRIPMGDPGNDYVEGYTWVEGGVTIDCERAKRALGGGEWMGFEQCVEETVEALEKHYNAFL